MKNVNTSRLGFTLIELLVVVLIIGILAAIAVPQYQVVLAKSRLSQMVQIVNSFKEAEELYFIDNNTYTDDAKLLDINFEACPPRAPGSDVLICNPFFMLDPIYGSKKKDNFNLKAYYCPKEVAEKESSVVCAEHADFVYTVWLEHSVRPNQVMCTGNTPFGQRVCRSF